jgi:hypothetical protein
MENLVEDRHRFYKLVLKLASWVASAARGVELWDDNLVIPPALAARAAVLAFGDELMHLRLPGDSFFLPPVWEEPSSRRAPKTGLSS